MIRFASGRSEQNQKDYAAQLLGTVLGVALIFGAIVQALAAPAVELLGIKSGMEAIRWTLLSSSVHGLIELPLVWLRFRDYPAVFFWFSILRSVAHVFATWVALVLHQGVEGVIMLNAWVALGFAALLVGWMIWDTGVSWSGAVLRNVFVYSLPLVGGGLALFSIATLNRWFLSGAVTPADIGLFGLALRLAMAASLIAVPLIMWWYPKRIAALASAEGRVQYAQVWGYGMATILLPSMGLALLGPVIVHLIFPPSYNGALAYLPGAILAVAVSMVAQFSNGGVHARGDGMGVLAVDAIGASTSVAMLFLLVPTYGVHGAIGSMVAAHAVRAILFHVYGQRVVRVEHPMLGISLAAALGVMAVWLAPDETALVARVLWAGVCGVVMIGILHWSGAAPVPSVAVDYARRTVARGRT
ncbi:MAG: hypothetical protein HC909_02145 [Blastochloris sp.]|nr:hypothetical protein [Blastochloris sp.]